METKSNVSFKEMIEKAKVKREVAMVEEIEKIKAEIAKIEKSIAEKEEKGETAQINLNGRLNMLKHRLSIYEKRVEHIKKNTK